MGNKVDIKKLIKKKYGDNTFELPDLFQEIDLVLNEMYDYKSKVDVQNLEEMPQGESTYDNTFGMGGAENPIAKEPGYGGRESSQVIPDKLAEGDEDDDGGGSQINSKTVKIKIFDMFSMITNSQMTPSGNDRRLLQRIVRNIGADKGFWYQRVQKMNEYTKNLENNPVLYNTKNIRQAVSNLIFLNLLKKISFFIAQPGKLFEYIVAPLIGTESTVLGSTDQQIVDLTKVSQGKTWNYSIKFFTGKSSDYLLKGSRKNLIATVGSTERPITYIVAVADETEGSISFAEFSVSHIPQHFPDSEWQLVKGFGREEGQHGFLYQKKQNPAFFGILVTKNTLENYEKNQNNLSSEEKADYNFYLSLIGKTQKGFLDREPSVQIQKPDLFDFKGKKYNLQQYKDMYKERKAIFDGLSSNNFKEYLKSDISSGAQNKDVATFRTAVNNAILLLKRFGDEDIKNRLKNGIDGQEVENIIPLLYPKATYPGPQDKFQLFNDIKNAFRKLVPPPNPVELNESFLNSEAKEKSQQDSESLPQFQFRLQNDWKNVTAIKLDLGDPKRFEKYQFNIASSLAKDMESVLDNFDKLNRNLVTFFATKPRKSEDPGGNAIKNAEAIQKGVGSFMEGEAKEPEDLE